jgi:hypothetical protein
MNILQERVIKPTEKYDDEDIQKLRKELEKMIIDNHPYEEIVKKSQELDKYIAKAFYKMLGNKN